MRVDNLCEVHEPRHEGVRGESEDVRAAEGACLCGKHLVSIEGNYGVHACAS